jgi:prepilin-type N-terminal cleavage/methylation domain-containing protein
MKSAIKNNSGFTVVELIMAIVVGSIFAGITAMIIVDQTNISQKGRDLVVANSFAETQIEALRSAGYNNLSIGTTNLTSSMPDELKAPRSSSLVISSPSVGIKQADLTITYNDQGNQRTYNYRSYVGELGVGQY